MIIYDKMRHKKIYIKINVIIKEVKPTAYVISIGNNYDNMNLKENDLYLVSYKLLYKCSEEAWNKNINKNENIIEDDEIIDNNYYIDEAEEEYIKENNSEFN